MRLLGVGVFLTGVVLGCLAALHWFQTGRFDVTLLEDVVVARLPAEAQAWIAQPRSWYGLHRFVLWILRIPVFASMGFVGFLLLLATATNPSLRPRQKS